MKTRTNFNKNHPVYIHNAHMQEAKNALRKLNNNDVRDYFSKLELIHTGTFKRSEFIRLILAETSIRFKKQWKERYGWDLDDARDQKLLEKRLEETRLNHQQKLSDKMAEDFNYFVAELEGRKKEDLDEEELETMEANMIKVATSIHESFNSKTVLTAEDLWDLVYSMQEAKEVAKEQKTIEEEPPIEKGHEFISWQKAKNLLGDKYEEAKEIDGCYLTDDGSEIHRIGTSWTLKLPEDN